MSGWLDYVGPLLGAGTALYGANKQNQAAQGAAAGARYQPFNINSPFGSTSYTTDPTTGMPTYTSTPGSAYDGTLPKLRDLSNTGYGNAATFAGMTPEAIAAQQNPEQYAAYQAANGQLGKVTDNANTNADQFSNLAAANAPSIQDYLQGRGALGGGSTALFNSSTDFLKNTDPSKLYDILSNIARPGETSATQNMFDRLQSTGRLGLQQNGVLGDLGGLDLAQKTANNDRAAQAYGFGQQNAIAGGNLGIQMGQLGNQDVGVYSGLLNNGLQSRGIGADAANSALTNAGTINDAGRKDLTSAIDAGQSGLNGTLGINSATLAPLNQSIEASTGRSVSNANAGKLSMMGDNGSTLGNLGSGILQKTLPGLLDKFAGAGASTGLGAAADAAGAFGVSSAPAVVPGIADVAAGAFDPAISAGLGSSGGAGVGAGAGAAGAAAAAPFSSAATGIGAYTPSAAVTDAIGANIGGGVAGATPASTPAALSSGAGAAAAIALPAMLSYMALSSQPYKLGGAWYDNMYSKLTNGTSGNETYDKFTSPEVQKNDAQYSLYAMLQQGPTHNAFGQAGAPLPEKFMKLAASYGMLNADGSVNNNWRRGPQLISSDGSVNPNPNYVFSGAGSAGGPGTERTRRPA